MGGSYVKHRCVNGTMCIEVLVPIQRYACTTCRAVRCDLSVRVSRSSHWVVSTRDANTMYCHFVVLRRNGGSMPSTILIPVYLGLVQLIACIYIYIGVLAAVCQFK